LIDDSVDGVVCFLIWFNVKVGFFWEVCFCMFLVLIGGGYCFIVKVIVFIWLFWMGLVMIILYSIMSVVLVDFDFIDLFFVIEYLVCLFFVVVDIVCEYIYCVDFFKLIKVGCWCFWVLDEVLVWICK